MELCAEISTQKYFTLLLMILEMEEGIRLNFKYVNLYIAL